MATKRVKLDVVREEGTYNSRLTGLIPMVCSQLVLPDLELSRQYKRFDIWYTIINQLVNKCYIHPGNLKLFIGDIVDGKTKMNVHGLGQTSFQ